MNDSDLELVHCKECDGEGRVECCREHMCPGTRKCYNCDGKGKHLSEKLRELKELLEKYR